MIADADVARQDEPAKDFLPAIGRLKHFRPPADSRHVRLDAGVREGDVVSVHYDPMIAKLIVWDDDRAAAVRRLRRALGDCELAGIATNLGFLSAVAEHPAFAAAEIDTGFIERHRAQLLPPPAPVPPLGLAFAALALLSWRGQEARRAAQSSADPHSPWHLTNGWRLNDDNRHDFHFVDGGERRPVVVHFRPDGWRLDLPDGPLTARHAQLDGSRLAAELNGERRSATVVRDGSQLTILHAGHVWQLTLDDPSLRSGADDDVDTRLAAPMPGTVVQVQVKAGQTVTRGQPLIVVEAMKMEHTIVAPADGTIAAVHFRTGDPVSEGQELLSFEAS